LEIDLSNRCDDGISRGGESIDPDQGALVACGEGEDIKCIKGMRVKNDREEDEENFGIIYILENAFTDIIYIHLKKLILIELSRPVSSDPIGCCLFFPLSAWFLGGATIFQPCTRWSRALTEPVIYITYFGENINDCELKSCIFIEVDVLLLSGRTGALSRTENRLSRLCTFQTVLQNIRQ
jgi:hypothetical protein